MRLLSIMMVDFLAQSAVDAARSALLSAAQARERELHDTIESLQMQLQHSKSEFEETVQVKRNSTCFLELNLPRHNC